MQEDHAFKTHLDYRMSMHPVVTIYQGVVSKSKEKKVPGDTAKQQSAHLQGLREESKIEYSPW